MVDEESGTRLLLRKESNKITSHKQQGIIGLAAVTRHQVMTPAFLPCPIAHSEAGSDQAGKRLVFYPATIQLPPSREA